MKTSQSPLPRGQGWVMSDEVDVDNLTELFEMFGLEVSVLKNVTKEEMLDSLAKFREKFL